MYVLYNTDRETVVNECVFIDFKHTGVIKFSVINEHPLAGPSGRAV